MSQNTERNAGNDAPPPTVPNLQIEALMGEMRRMLREECEQIHERLDRVEEGAQRRHGGVGYTKGRMRMKGI